MAKKLICDESLRLNIEPVSRLVIVEQGNNTMSLTYEQIIILKQMREGNVETYTSAVKPKNKFKLMKNYNILCECDEFNSTLYLRSDEKRDDLEALMVLMDSNKGKIARDKDIKSR